MTKFVVRRTITNTQQIVSTPMFPSTCNRELVDRVIAIKALNFDADCAKEVRLAHPTKLRSVA